MQVLLASALPSCRLLFLTADDQVLEPSGHYTVEPAEVAHSKATFNHGGNEQSNSDWQPLLGSVTFRVLEVSPSTRLNGNLRPNDDRQQTSPTMAQDSGNADLQSRSHEHKKLDPDTESSDDDMLEATARYMFSADEANDWQNTVSHPCVSVSTVDGMAKL